MARKTLGFVPLIWQCAFCNTQNPGPIKSCTSCGAPQPDDVEFLQVDEEQFNFIKDEALIRMAKAGPDIHCPFCGTRNLSTAEVCQKCGGELSVGGKARQTGQPVRTVAEAQAQARQPAAPAAPEKKQTGSKVPIIAALFAFVAIVACIILLVMLLRTDDVTATVTDVLWERSMAVEAYTSVTDSAWSDEVPDSAEVLACSMQYRYTADEPQPNATEVCGEAYVEDTGTGIGEVVQDCSYRVYDDYCEYTMMAWVVVDTVTESDRNLSPAWPVTNLALDQREGQRNEVYTITFSADGDIYKFTTSNAQLFMLAEIGSQWTLEINQLGGVQSAEPDN